MRSPAERIKFTLNGRPVEMQADPMRRLADVLRDELGLTGTKIGCNAGDCGACTVLLDGAQVCACLVPVARVGGRDVVTVEGLAEDGKLTALQEAFLRHGAAQCGICTPGMLMAATDLLARNPSPTRGAGAGCPGRRAVPLHRLPQDRRGRAGRRIAASEILRRRAPAVGARLAKVDGVAKLTGAEHFGADALPGGTRAVAARRAQPARRTPASPSAISRPLLAAHPGLVRVLTAADVPGRNLYGIYPTGKDQPVLAEGYVRHRGEAVCALVGDAETLAAHPRRRAADRLGHRCRTSRSTNAAAAPDLHAHAPGNVLCRGRVVARRCRRRRWRTPRARRDRGPDRLRRARLYRARGRLRRRVGDRIEIVACTQNALHGSRRNRRRSWASRRSACAHHADRRRRRLRRQARSVGAAADRDRRLAAAPAGADGLHAARKHGGDHQAPSGAHHRRGRRRSRTAG